MKLLSKTSGSAISRMLANICTALAFATAPTLKPIEAIALAPRRCAYVPELNDDSEEVLDAAGDKDLVPSMLDPNVHWDTERAQGREHLGVTQYALDVLSASGESSFSIDVGGNQLGGYWS